jgi:UDP-N-acetylmuramate dehydrogenase
MEILKQYNLKKHNTFGIPAIAEYFVSIKSEEDLLELVESPIFIENKRFVLGSGSNVLFSKDFDGLIISIDIKSYKIIDSDNDYVIIEAGAGEQWHDLVTLSLNNNYYGLENLALIPGKCGAAPVQNIGAYGIEQKDFFFSLDGFDITTKENRTLDKNQCLFSYRDSIFKHELKNNFIVTSVQYKLSKSFTPNLSYKELANELEKVTVKISGKDVFDCVCKLRTSKLPDYNHQGNAGSFFKNPIICAEHFDAIKIKYPDLNGYANPNDTYKISAGWLIEKAGWKGKSIGNAAVSDRHALIIVNQGNATGAEIIHLANQITSDVKKLFHVNLEKEVIII